ncbi:hypothetical protein ABW19_dt0207860 [Dactylella cylindrospora]|nr:hypothetical protein ABW19_dt0207860 [Dactylella cylindrospora]
MANKGKQKATAPPAPARRPTDTADILSSTISTLPPEPANNVTEDDERILEISTIAVIYPEFSKIGRLGGSLDIEISPSSPITTHFTLLDGDDITREDQADLSHLPPLTFEFQLPKGYPYEKPPSIRLTSTWLENEVIKQLKSELLEAWEGLRDQVIFTCIDILQSSAERLFDLPTPLDVQVNQKEKIGILEFDRATKVKKFNEGTFDCGVCLEPRKGADYFTAMIKEGDVGSVQCLNYVCGKDLPPEEVTDEDGRVHKIPRKPGAIAPGELQLLVEPDMMERYLKLKRKRAFEAMKNVVYCPRSFCKGPALRDSGDDQLAICQDCSLAFCAECGKTWHGYKASCRTAPSAATTKEQEKEAKLTEEFLEKNCTPCPTCLIPISKTGGCNHMYCSRCWTHFCLLCGAFLFPDNPYEHYSQSKSSCYNRLWEGVDDNGDMLPPPPPPAPPEEPPQPMMIQIVVPGQAPREVNPPPPDVGEPPAPEPQARVPEVEEAAMNEAEGAAAAGEENGLTADPEPKGKGKEVEDSDDDLEEGGPRPYLTEDDEAEFWVLYSRNECFAEGYNMLESDLTIKEIADFLRDWAAQINMGRRNKLGLAAYWRRLIEWRRKVRDPRLKSKKIDLGEYQFTDEAKRAAKQRNMKEEEDLRRRWWDIWQGGMREIAANKYWDEDELVLDEDVADYLRRMEIQEGHQHR